MAKSVALMQQRLIEGSVIGTRRGPKRLSIVFFPTPPPRTLLDAQVIIIHASAWLQALRITPRLYVKVQDDSATQLAHAPTEGRNPASRDPRGEKHHGIHSENVGLILLCVEKYRRLQEVPFLGPACEKAAPVYGCRAARRETQVPRGVGVHERVIVLGGDPVEKDDALTEEAKRNYKHRIMIACDRATIMAHPSGVWVRVAGLQPEASANPYGNCRLQDSGGLVITFTKVSSHPLDTSRHMSTQPASAAPLTCRSLFFFFYPFRPGRTSRDCNDFAAPSTPPPAPAAPRPRHLDLAVTPSTLPTRLQPPPRPRHAAATSTRPPLPTQPRYDASTSAVHLDLHRRRLDIAPTATSTPLRRFHQRRAPRPAPAPSRHSPHSHLDPATTLPPAPRTSTRTGAVSTQPPLPTRPRYDASTSAVYLDPHRRRLDTAPTATSTPLRRFHQRRAPRPAPAPSRHSPHSHLDPATTLPPALCTSTRTGAVST
ncbi:hypothetical protein EDB84DRAFT_1597579 [Lactarius hengduanensis]|nr:hypothetical protein EDB84DRAFT_1597579 [Lactarius hengduanensis]